MAQRINIYIPDELSARLHAQRRRLNVSSVCRDALDRELLRLEAAPVAVAGLDSVIERLRVEKLAFEEHWQGIGQELGAQWAAQASYAELRAAVAPGVEAPGDVLAFTLGIAGPSRDVELRWLDASWFETYPALRSLLVESDGEWHARDFDEPALARGWMAGVRELWEGVRDAL